MCDYTFPTGCVAWTKHVIMQVNLHQRRNSHRGLRWELRLRILGDRFSHGERPFTPIRDATGDLKICTLCGAQNLHMRRCSGCRWARYCSRACAENDWSWHKEACSPDERLPVNVEGIMLHGFGGDPDTPPELPEVNFRICAFCDIQRVHMKRCSGCHQAHYCSTRCQNNDWAQHKLVCAVTQHGSHTAISIA